jgi:uncharacterized protein DUF5658
MFGRRPRPFWPRAPRLALVPEVRRLYQAWDTPNSLFGDVAVVGFLLVQVLDGMFTYLGVTIWGLHIEANPLISSAVAYAGLGRAVVAAKMAAILFGILLHVRRVHSLVALLTAFYLVVAILPWALLFLRS